MKTLSSVACLLLFSFIAMSQYVQIGTMVDPAWKSRVTEAGNAWKGGDNYIIKGTIYYSEDMHKGYITLQDGRSAKDVFLRYNVYTHEINYLEDKTEMILDPSAPVHEFGYEYTSEDDKKKVLFRSGYPALGKNTVKTFYEVVAGGDIALLKYTSKKILEERTELGALQKVIIDTDSWYIYNAADKNIVEIKKNKNALMEALPGYAVRIKTITDAKGLRLKSNEDWIVLLHELASK
jgi:hypothetical protein